MYGTVAKLRLKPGMLEKFRQLGTEQAGAAMEGFIGERIYQMDADPNELYMVVWFTDKAAYQKNAASPGQDKRYQELRALLATDPEWHDGEVIFATG